MTLVKNYHNSIDLLTNTLVLNPFNSKLQGWLTPEDALRFENFDPKEIKDHQKWIIDYVDNPDKFNVNSNFFRSDEFSDNHDGKHILFSGCSVTYGVGLYTEELWSYLLYNKIKEKEKVSGYYNLGTPGTGVFDIVSNIFKYINMYGNPDTIFIDLPELTRFYALVDSKTSAWTNEVPINRYEYLRYGYRHARYAGDRECSIVQEKLIYAYQYLFMLQTFCKFNNIQLYLFSYIDDLNYFMNITDLDSYYKLNSVDLLKKIYKYHEDNPKDKFYLIARDNNHPGTGQHYAWAEEMYEKYAMRNYVN